MYPAEIVSSVSATHTFSHWLLYLCSFIGGSQRVSLVVAFAILPPKFYLWMIFCLSINVVWVSKLIGSGDTRTLTAVIGFIWTFCTQRRRGAKTLLWHPRILSGPSHLVKLSLSNIFQLNLTFIVLSKNLENSCLSKYQWTADILFVTQTLQNFSIFGTQL